MGFMQVVKVIRRRSTLRRSPPTDNRLVPPAAAGDPLPPAEGNTASSSAPRSVERRESNRFHTAKKLIRSLRPGSHGWADVTSSSNGEGGFAADESSFRSLDRGDPRYLSEGKGARRRRSRWQSEKELRPTNSVTLQHPKSSGDLERRPPTSSASASTLPSLHHSYLNVLISEDSSAGAGAGAAEVEEGHSDRIYQNLPSQPSTLPARGGRHNRDPSDEGRMESKKSSRSNGRSPADPVCPASSTCDSNDSSSSPVSSSSDEPYQRLLIDKEGGGARLERGKERRSFRKLTKDSGYETSNYAESDYVNMDNLSDIQSRESQQPKSLTRFPSTESFHSFSSAATLTAASVSSTKSTPTLTQESEHESGRASPADDMVRKPLTSYDFLKRGGGPTSAPLLPSRPSSSWLHPHGGASAEESPEDYISHLRSSSYQILHPGARSSFPHGQDKAPPPAPAPRHAPYVSPSAYLPPLRLSSSILNHHARQSSTGSSSHDDYSSSSTYCDGSLSPPGSQYFSIAEEREYVNADEFIDPPPPSKAHEKGGSWPCGSSPSSASTRSHSWSTDRGPTSPSPKELPIYAKPWKDRRPPALKPVEEASVAPCGAPEDDPSIASYSSLLAPVVAPSTGSRSSWRNPVTEESLAAMAESQSEDDGGSKAATPFMDQLRQDSMSYWGHQQAVSSSSYSDGNSDGRESVITTSTSSSNSSNDTLRIHGSLGDLTAPSTCQRAYDVGVAHSSRVPPPQRQLSEAVVPNGSSSSGGTRVQSSTSVPNLSSSLSLPEDPARGSLGRTKPTKPPVPPAKPTMEKRRQAFLLQQQLVVSSSPSSRKPSMNNGTAAASSTSPASLKEIQKQAVLEFFAKRNQLPPSIAKPPSVPSPSDDAPSVISVALATDGSAPREQDDEEEDRSVLDRTILPNSEEEEEVRSSPVVRSLEAPEVGGGEDENLPPPPTTTVMSPPVASASSESGASTSTVTETASEKEPPVEDTALQEPSVQRPPLPAPPAFQYHQQCIEEVAEDLRGLHKRHSSASSSSTSSSSRPLPPAPPKTGKPRAPSPPLPPPPPQEEAEVAADFPLPPPPLLEVEEDAQSTTSSTHSAPSSPSKPSPPQLAYHRDSYMVHRKERKLMGIPGGVSENGRYLRRHISPASHTVPPNQGAAEHQISDPGMKGSTTWDTRVLHGRQHSTTVNFTTAEVAALKEQRERAALLRSRSHAASLQPHSPPPKLPEKPLSLLSPPSSKSIGSLNVLSLPPPSEPSRDSPAPSLTSSSSYSNLGSLSRSSDCGSLPSSADSACYSSVGNLSSLLPRVSSSDTGLLLSAASSSVSLAFRDLRSTAKNSSSSGISSPVSSLSSPYHSRDNSTDDKVVEPSSVTPPFHPASRGTLLRPRSPPAPLVIEYRRRPRFPIEESCENAAKDFLPSLLATVKDRQREERLASILGPPSDIRSASDYLEGIFCRDCDEGRAILDKKLGASSSKSERSPTMTTSSPPQAANVPTATTIKGARPYRRSRHDPDLGVHKISSEEFASRKSQVMSSIDQKLEFLRKEKQSLREEEQQNEQLGATIRRRLEERRAEEKEREKVTRHVDEVEKISSLLLGLTERLARAENSLRTAEIADSEKVTLESKREKLVAQLMEAQNLKTNIEKRSAAVSRVLLKYLTDEEYTEYEHFIKTKPKLIFELHEISEKIRLGEEQLASLGPGSGLCLVTEEKNLSR